MHRRLTCPIFGKDTDCLRLGASENICYFDFHICFQPLNQYFRWQTKEFTKDTIIIKEPSNRQSKIEIAEVLSKHFTNEKENKFKGYGEENN